MLYGCGWGLTLRYLLNKYFGDNSDTTIPINHHFITLALVCNSSGENARWSMPILIPICGVKTPDHTQPSTRNSDVLIRITSVFCSLIDLLKLIIFNWVLSTSRFLVRYCVAMWPYLWYLNTLHFWYPVWKIRLSMITIGILSSMSIKFDTILRLTYRLLLDFRSEFHHVENLRECLMSSYNW